MRSTLGTTLLAICTLPTMVVAAAQAQNPVTNGIRAMAQRQTKNIVDAAEEMPADKYGYKPTPAQMSYGDVVAHLIKEGNNYLCSAASGMKQPDADKFAGADSKDKLVAGLKASFKFCETALAGIQDAQLGDSIDFFGGRKVTKGMAGLITVADWADHYSQMAIYLRLNGLLPPTAKKGMD
ncbi:MAG: DinB family protein [Gemmatimonadetes bacterium]|nr:MAG: DinB family protein [Gemmatimonadota bacterium]